MPDWADFPPNWATFNNVRLGKLSLGGKFAQSGNAVDNKLVVDSMIRFRDPVRVIQFATRSRSRIVPSFLRSVEFPVALTPLSLTDSAENRAMGSIP